MNVEFGPLDLTLRSPFRIARGTQHVAHNVQVEVAYDGLVGLGEAAPSAFYGERRETVLSALPYLAEALGDDPTFLEDATTAFDRASPHANTPAKAALHLALYDLLGKRRAMAVERLLGLNPAATPRTSFTIALDTPA